jgi:translation initiation factor IF-3
LAYQKSIKQQSKLRNRINGAISAPEVRVIDAEGGQIGVLPTREALAMAQEAGLDLIEINASSNPPITKIADWGKYRYENEKKLRKSLSSNKVNEVRQVRLGMRVGVGDDDIETKLRKVREFLAKGDRVRVFFILKGRQNAHTDLAFLLLERVCAKMEDSAVLEQKPTQNGRNFSVVFKSK